MPDRVFTPARSRPKRPRFRLLWQWALLVVSLLVLSGIGLGIAFAGSPETLPAGTSIAGTDVSGLTPGEARSMLEKRSRELDRVPVVFRSSGRSWEVRPASLLIETDWAAAVEAARRQGEGYGPVRGLRRLGLRVFGGDIVPRTQAPEAPLDYTINRFARAIDQPRTEPALRLRGLEPEIVPGKTGRVLDKDLTAQVVVRSLAAFSRRPVQLPVRVDRPKLAARELVQPLERVRTIVSAPVMLEHGPGGWRLPRWRLATMLVLPRKGSTGVRIGGPGANKFFSAIRKSVDRPATDASFAILAGNRVRVVPAKLGLVLDWPATARAILGAAISPANRIGRVLVRRAAPDVTTAEARAMRITGLVGAYETIYGGEPNRIHNVQLVARLIDGKLIAPGATFSFNGTTGERSEERGFREAPVIINGELQTGLGGGVCQVSTTVFNAAYEAGLPIESRTNHALYISHYPLGRDATVNYPDTDLKFTNDTDRWLLLRTFVGSSSLTVALYGTPQDREVESEVAPLTVTGPAPVKQVSDPGMYVGATSVEESGAPSRTTRVRRKVYDSSGKLLYDDTWSSWYRGEKRVIRVGTKPVPPPEPKEPEPKKKKKPPTPPPPPPASPPPEPGAF